MDFSTLVTREIDERFCYIKYDDFELIMMKKNSFINATKLCKLGGKEFRKWMRLDGSKELIRTVEEINGLWKINAPTRSGRGIIIEINGSNQYSKYNIAGSYIHQDLLPHVCSWISSSFAIKVSKIVNCYMSEQYIFKLKENEEEIKKRDNKIDELIELLYAFDKKYDRDTSELKERYREQRKEAKELKKQYDRDTQELKSSLIEVKKHNKKMEEKYDRDTRELKCSLTELKEYNKELKEQNKNLERKLERIEERLKDKVINPSSPNKLHRLVILQKRKDPNAFRTLRVQAERINQELNKVRNEYRVFFNAYEPNAVSCFNNLKERLLSQEHVKVNYNDFTLCDVNTYGVNELANDLRDLDLVRKYA